VSGLDRWLPEYRHNEIHEAVVTAPLEAVRRAVREVTGGEIGLARLLFAIRAVPARLLGRPVPERAYDRRILDAITAGGFLILEDAPDEVIVGVIGKFWQAAAAPLRLASPEEFRAFRTEGYARGIMDFTLRDLGDGRVQVRTETRVQPLGPVAARRFGLYWFFVHPGSALLRRTWLRAIKKRAEGR
jgi:hypothetical protein